MIYTKNYIRRWILLDKLVESSKWAQGNGGMKTNKYLRCMRFYSLRCFTGKEQQPLSNSLEFFETQTRRLNHGPKSVLILITNQYSAGLAMEDNHNKGEIFLCGQVR